MLLPATSRLFESISVRCPPLLHATLCVCVCVPLTILVRLNHCTKGVPFLHTQCALQPVRTYIVGNEAPLVLGSVVSLTVWAVCVGGWHVSLLLRVVDLAQLWLCSLSEVVDSI